MHELSLAIALLEALEERLRDRQRARVRSVHLRIGPLAGVVESALRSAFEIAAVGSRAEGARLVIEHTPLTVRCRSCGQERAIDPLSWEDAEHPVWGAVAFPPVCSVCGAGALDIVRGDELDLVAAEVVHD